MIEYGITDEWNVQMRTSTQDISTLYTVLIGVRKLDTIREQYGIAIIRGPIIADYARL